MTSPRMAGRLDCQVQETGRETEGYGCRPEEPDRLRQS